jgi:hypothetical protein
MERLFFPKRNPAAADIPSSYVEQVYTRNSYSVFPFVEGLVWHKDAARVNRYHRSGEGAEVGAGGTLWFGSISSTMEK